MSAVLSRLATNLALSKLDSKMVDYATAAASGLIDGFLLSTDNDAAALAFILKNVAVPIVDAAFVKLPKGLVYHSVGQLGMIAVLVMKG